VGEIAEEDGAVPRDVVDLVLAKKDVIEIAERLYTALKWRYTAGHDLSPAAGMAGRIGP
jgi:hypothetical protein